MKNNIQQNIKEIQTDLDAFAKKIGWNTLYLYSTDTKMFPAWIFSHLTDKPYYCKFAVKDPALSFLQVRDLLKNDKRIVAYNILTSCDPQVEIVGSALVADKTILTSLALTDGAFDLLELLDYPIKK